MIPWETVDRATTPDATPLTLVRHGAEWVIRARATPLMGSRMHASEDALGARGCAHLQGRADARVLVGGLGMGFTLRAALDALAPDARVDVVELVPEVIAWNRTHLADLAGRPLDDPRVTLHEGDAVALLGHAHGRWDAVLLDVDNGPSPFTTRGNGRLYSREGLSAAWRALRDGGVLAVWSAGDDEEFTERLARARFEATRERVRAHGRGGGTHHLWLAQRRARS